MKPKQSTQVRYCLEVCERFLLTDKAVNASLRIRIFACQAGNVVSIGHAR